MATFESTGHTVFREGNPAIPDISGEKRGRRTATHGSSSANHVGRVRGGGRLKRVRLSGRRTGGLVSRILGRSRKKRRAS